MTINFHIEYHDCIKSTQDLLKNRIVSGVSEGLVIQAGEQTSGYGRHGRQWVSAPGNLYFSFLLKPDCNVQDVGQLALVVGLSVGQGISEIINTPDVLMLKWPNDVLLDGKKCAGILIETDGAGHVMVGVGVNVVSAPEMAVAMQNYMEFLPNIEVVLNKTLHYVDLNYSRWTIGDFENVRQDWLSMAHKPGCSVTVKIGEQVEQGTFHDINTSGAMIIKGDQGTMKTITAGDVFLTTEPNGE